MALEKNGTISDAIYKELMDQICTGVISTDTTLTESTIVQMFKVSKAPVREALIKLCHENVLESRPRSGYKVCPISQKDISDVLELRLYLELGSLQRINDKVTTASLETIRRLSDERNHIIRTNKTVWQLWNNNINFHMELNKIAGNEQVYSALERSMSTCTRAYAQIYVSRHEIMYASSNKSRHDFIVDAIERHDIFTAYNQLKEDILYLQTFLKNQL